MIAISMAIFIVVFNYPTYAFFSDTKLIECSSTSKMNKKTIFKYEKKLLSEPTLTERRGGLWLQYCKYGKLTFNEDSIKCKTDMYKSLLDLVTNEYLGMSKLNQLEKEQRYSERYICKIMEITRCINKIMKLSDFPNIANQLSVEKNGISIQTISYGSHKLWWQCDISNDHIWETEVRCKTKEIMVVLIVKVNFLQVVII